MIVFRIFVYFTYRRCKMSKETNDNILMIQLTSKELDYFGRPLPRYDVWITHVDHPIVFGWAMVEVTPSSGVENRLMRFNILPSGTNSTLRTGEYYLRLNEKELGKHFLEMGKPYVLDITGLEERYKNNS